MILEGLFIVVEIFFYIDIVINKEIFYYYGDCIGLGNFCIYFKKILLENILVLKSDV